MRHSDIQIGTIYRHKTSSIGYAQAVKVLPPRTGENTTTRHVVKCAWSTEPTFQHCWIYKYFKSSDLTPYVVNGQTVCAAKGTP